MKPSIRLLYLTGLGDVNPPVPDGVAAPLSPVSNAVTQPIALVDNQQATVGFAGLTPTIVGLYAITLTIPSDLAPGDVYVDISLPDSYTTEAILPIGTSNLRADQPGAHAPSLPSATRSDKQWPGSGATGRFAVASRGRPGAWAETRGGAGRPIGRSAGRRL